MIRAAGRMQQRHWQVMLGMVMLLMAAVLLSATTGAMGIDVTGMILRWLTGQQESDVLGQRILLEIRVPRIVMGLVVGGGLALAGAVMQALFRNPLADPGLVGISSGAALGAVTAIVMGAGTFVILAPAAFCGSLIVTFIVYGLGRKKQGVAGLLLAGIALNALCMSVIGLFSFMATDSQLRSLTFWNLGSLAQGNGLVASVLCVWTLCVSALLYRHWRALNALLLGEREAWQLGYPLKRLRIRLIVLVALLVGPLVSATGIIGFVGLVIPHVLRMLCGSDHRYLLPATFVGGALVLTLADWSARMVMMPAEVPVGIVTSLIGAPFFLWILTRHDAVGG